MNRHLRIKQAVLLAALFGALSLIRAAETPPQPLFPGITPVCSCGSLTNVSLPNTTIESATLDPPNGWCRVTAAVTHPPSGDRVKIWIGLPVTNWNGRFRGNGGGGFSGGGPGSLQGPVAQGFAAGATDTGHEGGSGSFALDADGRLDWQAIRDNAYLGVHDMTVVGKALAQAFYGKAPRYSYFVGGSTGGRQGLMEAQRYPADYDGILSACPAINWHRFLPADLWPQVVMVAANNFVPRSKLAAATAAAVAACDALDEVTDGVIDDPSRCAYDPKALVGTQVGDETFTESDADVIRRIWEGPRGQDGTFLWHGLARGTDLFALAGTAGSPLKGKPFSIPLEWFQYFLLQDPNWDWTTLSPAGFELLWRQSVEQYGAVIGTDDPDLSPFRDRGGKIIIYHGLADQLIPAEGTVDYYRRLRQQMGGAEKTSQFARLFLAPGVDHGFRGAGPAPTGQMEAIIRWVEQGQAPDKLIAERRDSNGNVVRTRPLFPYPQVARHNGTGSTDDAANFVSQTLAELQEASPPPRSGNQDRSGRGRRQPASRRSQRVRMQEVSVSSPDGRVRFTVLPNAERLTFTVTMDDTAVLETSALDMRLDGYDLSTGVSLGDVESFEVNETYPWHGAHGLAVNHCNGARITLTNDLSSVEYVLEIRTFNDGVAYRHVIPGRDDAAHVPEEFSSFVLPAGSTVWYHDLSGHYEAPYHQRDITEVSAGQWAGPPLTFQLPGGAGYGSMTEANLVNYAGMALECDGRRGWIIGLGHRQPLNWPFELRYGREEAKRLGKPAAIQGTIATPWRVVLVGRDLNTLVNSDILPNLCPAADPNYFPQGLETPWVEPGLAVWDYVDRNYVRPDSNRLEHMKAFSRLGGRIGAKYHILEGFAYGWSDEEIREFVDYSKAQGVRVLFWRHSQELRTPEAQEEFFSRLHRLGVAGAKIDFIDQEAKEGVDQYEALLRKAAEYQCVIDFHGANKPTGRSRTWPNDMLREAVRGMESTSLRERARHETILPFARYLAGPTDYTTMHFGSRRADSTWAHQIACLATFHSPILTIAAHPQSVLDNPALEVIKRIPAVWDETVVLPDSRIGELSMFARRKGEMWILAVMGAAGPGRTLQVPLRFLGDGNYQAVLVRDNKEDDAAVVIENSSARRTDTLTVELRGGGGFVGSFIKQ